MNTSKNQTEKQLGSRLGQNGDIILHSSVIIIVLLAGVTGWIHWSVVQKTFIGMLVAGTAGLALGVVAQWFLARSHNTRDTLFGMAVTTSIGVLTIGYLYMVYIKGPMQSIGTPARMIEQTAIFLEFLIAQVSGIRLGKGLMR